uniref:hypothetical protein n=1 Tax=Eubacterium sp. TaxID=142586 RepID=UPI003FEF2BEF
MQAYKCDRCGGLYQERPVEALRKISRICGRQVCGIAFDCVNQHYDMDLCPDCLAEFEKWYASGAVVKELMK